VPAKLCCLIIDDSEVVRRVMRSIIEGLNVEVTEAASSAEAIALCRAKMPDFILLDWHLPGSQPIETLVSLRMLPGGKQMKLLYVTTNNDPAEIGRAITAGAHDYMIKPFRRVTLEAKLASLMARPRSDIDVKPSGLLPRRAAIAV